MPPRSCTPEQEAQIRAHCPSRRIDEVHAWATATPPKGLGLKISRAKIGQLHAQVTTPAVQAKPPGAATETDRIAYLEERVAALTARLDAFLTLPKVKLEEVAPMAVEALRLLLQDPTVPPAARVKAAEALPELLKIAKEIADGSGDDGPEGF